MNNNLFCIDFKGKKLFFDMDGNYVEDNKVDYNKVFKSTVSKEKNLYNKILMYGVLCGLKFKVINFKDKKVIMPIDKDQLFLTERVNFSGIPLISCINAIRFLANGYDGLVHKDLKIDLTSMNLNDFASRILLDNKTEGSRDDLEEFLHSNDDPENLLVKYAKTHETSSYNERYNILADANSLAHYIVFNDYEDFFRLCKDNSDRIYERLKKEAYDVIPYCKTNLICKDTLYEDSRCTICDIIDDDIHDDNSGYIFGKCEDIVFDDFITYFRNIKRNYKIKKYFSNTYIEEGGKKFNQINKLKNYEDCGGLFKSAAITASTINGDIFVVWTLLDYEYAEF